MLSTCVSICAMVSVKQAFMRENLSQGFLTGPDTNQPTVMILSFRTDRLGQTLQTQIILLLEEQSDQGLHFLPFNLHTLGKNPSGLALLFEF